MQVTDLAIWNDIYITPRVGMRKPLDVKRDNIKTEQMKKRQMLIYKHINDEFVLNTITEINTLQEQRKKINNEIDSKRNSIESHLSRIAEEYEPYFESKCCNRYTYDQFVKSLNKQN